MTSARERAVEAGAEVAALFDHEVFERLCRSDQVAYLDLAKAVLSAAFPILAEELVKEIEAKAVSLERRATGRSDVGDFKEAYLNRIASTATMDVASELRARIQHMAEAEHE